jgi:predicted component of type VI protein secretion system
MLLEEEVVVRKASSSFCGVLPGDAHGLGGARLGFDLVCGEKFFEDFPVIEFVVGPLIYSKVADYLEGGERNVLLTTFSRFFVPAGVDTDLIILLPEERQNMTLEKGKGPILGYSSVLG